MQKQRGTFLTPGNQFTWATSHISLLNFGGKWIIAATVVQEFYHDPKAYAFKDETLVQATS